MIAATDQVAELRAEARRSLPWPTIRYPFAVRYAREMGWLEVRDCFTREWLQVWGADCPPAWRRAAYAEKQARRQDRETKVSHPRPEQRPAEEEVAF